MGTFKIDVDEFSWIGGAEDDPSDRCLHGRVTVQIGQTVCRMLVRSARRLFICSNR